MASPLLRFHFFFNLIMMTIYALAGIYFIFILNSETISPKNARLIGAVLLLYAGYRGYRLYAEKKKQDNTTDNPQ